MFQIGRSTNSNIDFVVSEPSSWRGKGTEDENPGRKRDSAVSRFACRIHIERRPPFTARIYAAGFDDSKNIFLGELAMKWTCLGQLDGLTTNGVMTLRCSDITTSSSRNAGDDSKDVASSPRQYLPAWREVSVCGAMYEIGKRRCIPTAANLVHEDNILVDKMLIDICGVILFWRSGTGLQETVSPRDLQMMIDGLNESHLQCPVLFRTLRLPNRLVSAKPSQPRSKDPVSLANGACSSATDSKPYVYLNCGHVHGWHTWRANADSNRPERTCPQCMQPSRFVPLKMGLESAFYIDKALPNHCFNPCGHMASEMTVRFWCSVQLLDLVNTTGDTCCPFCLTSIKPTPVRLRFYGDLDEEGLVNLLKKDLCL